MAEGLARQMVPTGLQIFSAGSAPTQVNRFAVEAMKEAGIGISGHRSKSVDEIDKGRVGTVITSGWDLGVGD